MTAPTPTTAREGFTYNPSTQTITHGLPTPSIHPSTPNPSKSYNTIIIGAGLTGLTAARDLSLANKNVLLLEARDRIGGRTWTAKTPDGQSHEMGGAYVYWLQPHVWAECSRYGLTELVRADFGDGVVRRSIARRDGDGKVLAELVDANVQEERLAPLIAKFFDIDGQGGRSIFPQPHLPLLKPDLVAKYDISIGERITQLNLSQDDEDLLRGSLSFAIAVPLEQVSFLNNLRLFALSNYDYQLNLQMNGCYKIPGGTTALANAMLKEFKGDVLFNETVRSIEGGRVSTKSGKVFEAEYVVCTLPVNCLGDIEFDPPLPGRFGIRHEASPGKMHIRSEAAIGAYMGIGLQTGPVAGIVVDARSSSGGTDLVAFTNVPSPDPTVEGIENFRARLHKEVIPSALGVEEDEVVWVDWYRDEFAKGSWAQYAPGLLSHDLGKAMKDRKINDRVLYASADVADGWVGYIDGAIEQGKRVAFQLSSA